MIPLKDNQDIASFLVTKHSTWKGKYKRVFSIGTHGITTYNPEKFEITNRWPYNEIITIASGKHSNSKENYDFTLVLKKDRKTDSMKFSSEHKCMILTEAFKFRNYFADKPKDCFRYEAFKHHWSDIRLPVILEVTPCSLDQLDSATHTILASYSYYDIDGIIAVQDYPGGFVVACGGFSRLHLFASNNYTEIRNKMLELANLTLNYNIKVLNTTITMDDFHNQRFGKYSGDNHQTSISEFVVQKLNSVRHREPPKRILCISETCLLERDPQTYSVCCLRPLCDVYALVRDPTQPQHFSIEYVNGQTRSYLSTDRDSLLATLMDGVRSSGNRDVHVKMKCTARGKRFGPLHVPVDEETESNHLRLFQNPGHITRADIVERFNVNVGYSGLIYSINQDGLFSENKEKLILQALQGLMQFAPPGTIKDIPLVELEQLFHALRRLCASKAGYAAFTTLPDFREWCGNCVVSGLRRGGESVCHGAVDALCCLLQPMHARPDLRQEQMNKHSMLSNKTFLRALLDMTVSHVNHSSGSLVVMSMLDFLTFTLCAPYSETTDGKLFDQLLELVAEKGRELFKLFEHPSVAIVKGAGLVMRALVEEGSEDIGRKMQSMALSEAAVIRQLRWCISSGRSAQHTLLARHLVALFTHSHAPSRSLLTRIFPPGLLAFLESMEQVPAEAQEALEERNNLMLALEASRDNNPQWQAIRTHVRYVEKHLQHYTNLALQHWAQHTGMVIERKETIKDRPVVLRKRREHIKSNDNWPLFYYQFNKDHALPNLIWNHTTRSELLSALEAEVRALGVERSAVGRDVLLSWNHAEFLVTYPSLQQELKVGDYYLRILLEKPDDVLRKCYEFFNELYHRYLTTSRVEMKCMCLQAMSIVYRRYYEDIGPFTDTRHILEMLERTCERGERDRLISVCEALSKHPGNVAALTDGARTLIDVAATAHLHASRAAPLATRNVLQHNDTNSASAEWYYRDAETRHGPFTPAQMKELFDAGTIGSRTRVWAHGMESWRTLAAVPQLKWTLLARGTPYMDESQLAINILDLFNRCCSYYPSRDEDNAIIRPLPRIKRVLSDNSNLPHLVQLLLTFDPTIVEKVATLLHEIMQDNPEMSKLYMTGVFYFILMYTGSNVLPIAKFLQLTHMQQAFRADENTNSDIMQQSILGQLLPEAMVCYLHNHGADKFAQIFLGEYDTPEAIWNSEMRRMLTMKISAHIGEFTPRLRSHTTAKYPYLAIPAVRYPQLEAELFCHIFYLRHLCDTAKFPDWPIADPVILLREVLAAWRREVSRRPGQLSVESALAVLSLQPGADDGAIRKAYYKLAQQFHPDKNPDGREIFESISQAYEFLCSRNIWTGEGPNPDNIMLILRTQTILFERYHQELREYKYAGYGALISTMKLESESDQLFNSKSLLPAAVRLARATLAASQLNADELFNQGGLQILSHSLVRCASVVTAASTPDDTAVLVCEHAAGCVAIAATYEPALNHAANDHSLVTHLSHLLKYTKLSSACSECARAIGAVCSVVSGRATAARAGALHSLLAAALLYDYTLVEGGVETDPSTNKQEKLNQLALVAVDACAKIASYCEGNAATTYDAMIRQGLQKMLTPYLYNKLKEGNYTLLLKTLTSNVRNPYLIWDNSSRAELQQLLDGYKTRENCHQDGDAPLVCDDFKYTIHCGLLNVGNIFLPVYNEMPSYPLENPKQFVLDLLAFLKNESLQSMNQKRISEIEMTLNALANVIVHNQGVELQCIGELGTVLGLVGSHQYPVLQRSALSVLQACSKCSTCLDDIAASQVLGHLLSLIPNVKEDDIIVLNILNALIVNTKIVREALAKGAVVYLLYLFCTSKMHDVRVISADILGRMMADKLNGPKVERAVRSFVPDGVCGALREAGGGSNAVRLYDADHNNPELVWDSAARGRLSAVLSDKVARHHKRQLLDARVTLEVDSTTDKLLWAAPDELHVAGVYVRLFIQNPTWRLRSPNIFLTELIDEMLRCYDREPPQEARGGECCTALYLLLRTNPALCEFCSRTGHLPRLARLLPNIHEQLLPAFTVFASDQSCVTSLSQTDVVIHLKDTLKQANDHLDQICEVISKIYNSSANTELLVYQALEYSLATSILNVVEGNTAGSVVAHCVGALRAMETSIAHGDRVRRLLAKSTVWSRLSAMKHDLFIGDTPRHTITGVTSAGYLTAPPAPVVQVPPPVD